MARTASTFVRNARWEARTLRRRARTAGPFARSLRGQARAFDGKARTVNGEARTVDGEARTAALIREGRITSPWIDLVKSWLWGWQVAILVTIGPIVAYCFARRWLRDFATKRVGRAEVFEAGVVFYRADQMTPVPWSMLGGFDDSSADVIELQLKGSRVRFTIPTPQEDLRVRVLALLEERGIPRLDV